MSKVKLIFIHGPAGVGKTTACTLLHSKLDNSAWLESEWCWAVNPFVITLEMKALCEKNTTFILRNYLESNLVKYVVFNWVLHRKEIWDAILNNLKDIDYELFQ